MQCGVPKCAPCVNYEKKYICIHIIWLVVFLYFTQKKSNSYYTYLYYLHDVTHRSEKPTTINVLHITKFTMLTGL